MLGLFLTMPYHAFTFYQAEGLLTYEIHPPQNRVESYGDNGESEISFELDEKAFLDVRDIQIGIYCLRE